MQWIPWIPALLVLPLLIWAARRLPWYKLQGDREAQNILIIATAFLMGIRWFNTTAMHGLSLHFVLTGVAVLMFGARFALWIMALVSLAAWGFGTAWHGVFFDFLATGAIPIAIVVALKWMIERWLPPHLLMYTIGIAFAGGALSIAACNLFKTALSTWIFNDINASLYLIATVPMMFGEGFLCGGIMTIIVVYRPQWCISFDDARYIPPPNSRIS